MQFNKYELIFKLSRTSLNNLMAKSSSSSKNLINSWLKKSSLVSATFLSRGLSTATPSVCNSTLLNKKEKSSQISETSKQFSSLTNKNQSSAPISDGSASIENSELIIQHLHEGIVEVQLNRAQAKNSLSKKLLFEV